MEQFILSLVCLPLLGFIVLLFLPKTKEKMIARWMILIVLTHLLLSICYFISWIYYKFPTINVKEIIIYKSQFYEFYIDFYLDKISITFLLLGAFVTFLIVQYSRFYMHRESGFKRFFSTLLFFYLGYAITITAGNLETLFIGWEILGISSFLLIAFYRERYLPVKNAVKVFSIYRIGDVGILLAMWLSHHLWHSNISFVDLWDKSLLHEHLMQHSIIGVSIALLLLLSAMAKSALFPFSSWLPRAMEGPTPSSAVFYGALSVHIGAFLLLRTFAFWNEQTTMRIVVALIGLITAVFSILTGRVQSNIKSQIAYSSLAQIGLIFIEIAFGFIEVALVHIAGNALLRTYQLLISPSTVTYKIREQFFNFVPKKKTIEDSWPKKIEYTLYMLSLKEWNLDNLHYDLMWNPLKKLGKKLSFLGENWAIGLGVFIFICGLIFHITNLENNTYFTSNLPTLFAVIGLLFVLKSFTERKNVFMAWWLIVANHLWIALAISYNEHFELSHHIWYLSGVIVAGFSGHFAFKSLKKNVRKVSMDQFYGLASDYPKLSMFVFICGLVLAGFPISPTFIGEDLIFSHIHENQPILALIVSLSLIIDGISLIRIYSRVFLGPNTLSNQGFINKNV